MRFPKKRSYILLVVLVICSGLLALFSYYYSSIAAQHILELASEDIRSNAKIQAHDLGFILSNALTSASSNLNILSTSEALSESDNPLLDIVRTSPATLSVEYLGLDHNGRIIWPEGERSHNANLSLFWPDFNNLRTDDMMSISSQGNSLLLSNGIPDPITGKMFTLMVSPVTNKSGLGQNSFSDLPRGAIIASIRFENDINNQASLLRTETSDEVKQNTVILVDKGGAILESNNISLIGTSLSEYFEQIEILDSLAEIEGLGSDSLASEEMYLNFSQGMSVDVTFRDREMSLISEPISLGNDQVWTLYVLAPHLLTHEVDILLGLQNSFSTLMIILIGIVAFIVAMIILLWNKRLGELVSQKTADLKKMNNYLLAANEQLKTHDLMQKEFLNIASHEMKTPTQTILLHSNLLSIQPNSDYESVGAIIRNARRLQKLVNEILDIARIESKSLKLNKERINLNQIIASIIEEYSTLIDNGKLMIQYEDKDVFVIGDKGRITQVISNLVDNAVKFTKEGFIAINTRIVDDSFALVTITDTGSGIDPRILPRIFDKFVTKSDQGVGLGLYISKNIIEAHGGTICAHNNKDTSYGCSLSKYHSHNLKEGATFTFTLITKAEL